MRKLLLKLIIPDRNRDAGELNALPPKQRERLWASKLTALQALDVGYADSGKIILLATVGGKDIVKIYHMERKCSLQEYKERCLWIENVFGARVHYEDLPRGAAMDFGTFKRR